MIPLHESFGHVGATVVEDTRSKSSGHTLWGLRRRCADSRI